MFKLSKLKIGQKANLGHLKTLIENQNFIIHGNQVVGEIVQWVGGDSVESIDHLNYAPDSTIIYAREEYYGSASFTKNNGEWFVTSIRTFNQE